jgi:hypothetical protein
MGYRSTVAYTIRFGTPSYDKPEEKEDPEDAKRSFYTFLAEAKANVNTALCFSEQEDEVFKVLEDKLEIRFFAEGVKWYESYPDVACHEALIELSKSWADDDTSNPYIGGAFARVGEDTNDNVEEIWGQGEYSWVGVNRSVYADWYE